jgi:hypothetical protein
MKVEVGAPPSDMRNDKYIISALKRLDKLIYGAAVTVFIRFIGNLPVAAAVYRLVVIQEVDSVVAAGGSCTRPFVT